LGASADRAVDGNTDGDFSKGSVTHTDPRTDNSNNTSAWWEVELDTQHFISGIEVWNRTDCWGTAVSSGFGCRG